MSRHRPRAHRPVGPGRPRGLPAPHGHGTADHAGHRRPRRRRGAHPGPPPGGACSSATARPAAPTRCPRRHALAMLAVGLPGFCVFLYAVRVLQSCRTCAPPSGSTSSRTASTSCLAVALVGPLRRARHRAVHHHRLHRGRRGRPGPRADPGARPGRRRSCARPSCHVVLATAALVVAAALGSNVSASESDGWACWCGWWPGAVGRRRCLRPGRRRRSGGAAPARRPAAAPAGPRAAGTAADRRPGPSSRLAAAAPPRRPAAVRPVRRRRCGRRAPARPGWRPRAGPTRPTMADSAPSTTRRGAPLVRPTEGGRWPSIQVVTDSACDLTPTTADEHDVRVVPLTIRFGAEELVDRDELSIKEFWDRVITGPDMPETAAPSPGAFRRPSSTPPKPGSDGVVCITLSSGCRPPTRPPATAAEDLGRSHAGAGRRLPERHHGPGAAGPGRRRTWPTTARGLDDIVAARRGRCGTGPTSTASLGQPRLPEEGRPHRRRRPPGGSLLSIKPVIEVRDGVVEVESKQRTRSRALQYLATRPSRRGRSNAWPSPTAWPRRHRRSRRHGAQGPVPSTSSWSAISVPSSGAHAGPGTVGRVLHHLSRPLDSRP